MLGFKDDAVVFSSVQDDVQRIVENNMPEVPGFRLRRLKIQPGKIEQITGLLARVDAEVADTEGDNVLKKM